MINRTQIRIPTPSKLIRIFKSQDGKTIYVYKHDFSEELTRILGDDRYEIQGYKADEFSATGAFRYTLKEVAEIYRP